MSISMATTSSSSTHVDEISPVAVAIVTFGLVGDVGDQIRELYEVFAIPPADVVDLRWHLEDPRDNTSRVKHHQDGTYNWTQRAVYSQSALVKVMTQCPNEVIAKYGDKEEHIVAFRACRTGFHRADTISRTEKERLNRMEGARGGRRYRVFNAQHFPLCDVLPSEVHTQLSLAFEWAAQPFVSTKDLRGAPRQDLCAYEARASRREAMENLTELHYWVEQSRIVTEDQLAVKEEEESPKEEAPSPPREEHKASTLVGAQPKRRPTLKGSVHHARPHAPSPRRSPKPPNFPPPVVKATAEAKPGDMANREDLPIWATFDRGIDKWYEVLATTLQCDAESIQDLFLLARHSVVGNQKANTIIAKLLKKKQDFGWTGTQLANPLRFLNACVKNARATMP
jgi:hypothetical protein